MASPGVLTVKLPLRLAYGANRVSRWRQLTLPLAAAVTTFVALFMVGFFRASVRVDERLEARSFHAAQSPDEARVRLLRAYDSWEGRQFEVRYVEPVTEDAPLPPGLSRWLRPGEYAVSRGLARALGAHPSLKTRYHDPLVLDDTGTSDGSEWIAYGAPPAGTAIDQARGGVLIAKWGAPVGSSGDARTDLRSLRLPVLLLLGLPVVFLTWGAARTAAPLRDSRAQVLHWLGARRRVTSTLATVECAALVVPGVLLGALSWASTDQAVTWLPLTGYRPVHGDLSVSLLDVTLVAGLVIATVSGHTFLRTWRVPRLATGTRPWVEPRLSRLGLVPAVAGVGLIFWQMLNPAPRQSVLLLLLTPLLLAVGAALLAPFLVRSAGAAVAMARRSVVALLAGRAVQRDAAGFVRPVLGLGVFAFLALVGLHLVFVESDFDDPVNRTDPQLQAATVVLSGRSSDQAARTVAERLPGTFVAPLDRGSFGIAGECQRLAAVFGTPACGTDGQLDGKAVERLTILLDLPPIVPVRLVDKVVDDPAGPAPALLVIGQRDPEFASDVANSVMPRYLTVQVITLDDFALRPSGVWGWIKAGLAAGGLLTALGLFITAVDRSMQDGMLGRLRALGASIRVMRRLYVARFLLAYSVVVGTMLAAGLANGWLILRSHGQGGYPQGPVLWIVAMALLLPAAAALALLGSREWKAMGSVGVGEGHDE